MLVCARDPTPYWKGGKIPAKKHPSRKIRKGGGEGNSSLVIGSFWGASPYTKRERIGSKLRRCNEKKGIGGWRKKRIPASQGENIKKVQLCCGG